jgi:hydrogenase maturation protease
VTAPRRQGAIILGLGNVLCRDDGIGVAAVAAIARKFRQPPGLRFIDGGTLGLSLLPILEDAEAAILVDAIRADAPPGTVVRLEGCDVTHAAAHRLSVHQVGVADLLGGARLRGRLPARLVLCGVVPASIELGVERTPAVEAALPALIEAVVREAEALGYVLFRRSPHEVDAARGRGVHHVLGL